MLPIGEMAANVAKPGMSGVTGKRETLEMKLKPIKTKRKTWPGSAAKQTAGAFSFVLEGKKNMMRYDTIEVEQ